MNFAAAPVWGLAVLGMAASYALRALRQRAEWQDRGVGFARCLHVVLLHNAAVNLLPMRSGELGYPLLLYRHWGVPVGESAASLLWMRVQDAVVLAALAGIAALGWAVANDWMSLGAAIGAGVLAAIAGLLLAVQGTRWSERWLARGTEAARHPRIARITQAVLSGWARNRVASWVWSAGNWLVKLAVLGLLLSQLADVPLLVGWCGALAGEWAAALPVQPPAGFGTYEGAVWLGARLAGASNGAGALLANALTVHLFVIGSSLAGAAVAWMPGLHLAQVREKGDPS